MKSREELYYELGYTSRHEEVMADIEQGLLKNEGSFRYYYHTSNQKVPASVMNTALSHLDELGYRTRVGIKVNKGKYIQIDL